MRGIMARKEMITIDKILDTAFAMTREEGFANVTARRVAAKAGCSTQPIFRVYKNMEELLQHPKILGLFRARIDTLQQQFAHYEQVKRFTLLPEPFSMERGELTNTLKLKRSVVAENYKELIEKMYEE